MRLLEFTHHGIDEGIKDWLGKAALATALTVSPAADAKPPAVKAATTAISSSEAETVLMRAARAAGLRGTELAAFMAQCAHETLNFKHLKEIGGSLDFKKYDPKYNRTKARQLGNIHAGDGARYAGRGFIQLTGRDNYRRAGRELGLPLEDKPQMVEQPSVAARVAVWFWKKRVAPEVDNFNDVKQVTRKINPGLRGLESRKNLFQDYKKKLSGGFKLNRQKQ